jgi:hypothetical protein
MSATLPVVWSLERLETWSRACAMRDRRAHRPWVSDAELEGGVRGYARCIAAVTGKPIVLTAADIERAIAVYRRTRRLKARADASQRVLITVVDSAA